MTSSVMRPPSRPCCGCSPPNNPKAPIFSGGLGMVFPHTGPIVATHYVWTTPLNPTYRPLPVDAPTVSRISRPPWTGSTGTRGTSAGSHGVNHAERNGLGSGCRTHRRSSVPLGRGVWMILSRVALGCAPSATPPNLWAISKSRHSVWLDAPDSVWIAYAHGRTNIGMTTRSPNGLNSS